MSDGDTGERHRLLAIDGDGRRIYLSIRILRRLEDELRRKSRDPTMTLGRWFDYVGGTNTGGLVAALVALGLSTREIEQRLTLAEPELFRRRGPLGWVLANGIGALLRPRQRASTSRKDRLERILRSWFTTHDGQALTLGDVAGEQNCHLLLSLYNLSTDSPWPLSTNPAAVFNADPVGSNLSLELWAVARATMAAPGGFDPVRLPIIARTATAHDFADGSVAGTSNVVLQLLLMAVLDSYELRWNSGPDKLLVVSVGSGVAERLPRRSSGDRRPGPAHYARRDQTAAMMRHRSVGDDMLCRAIGQVRWAAPQIDLELAGVDHETAVGGGNLFSYVRYNDSLTDKALRRLNVGHAYGDDVRRRYRPGSIGELRDIGDAIASQVDASHLDGF
ncbi:MAG: patatin-like phospholipase family protein [Acidimicrobiales bacterium]